jgi:hypothetical protein
VAARTLSAQLDYAGGVVVVVNVRSTTHGVVWGGAQVLVPSSPTLGNLVKTLGYHKQCQKYVPMTPKESEQNARIVNELSSTLKTIFKV